MTNTKGIILLFSLATILITGGLTMAPLAYSTGGYHDDSHDDSGCNDDSYDDSHDDSNCNPEPDCDCKKPTVFTVIYKGPGIEDGLEGTTDAEVTVEIYKKVSHIGDKDPLFDPIQGIFDGESILIDSNSFGKKKLNSNTVYRVMQNGAQIAVVSFHTSCSDDMLFVGNTYSDENPDPAVDPPVTLTVESGLDHKERQSIFLPVDPICNEIPETTLEVKKVLIPADDPGRFNLLIDGTPEATDVGDGGTTGPVVVTHGVDIPVGESGFGTTNLADYTTTFSEDCADEIINVEEGDDAECIITNTKKVPAMITFKKALTNDNGGDALPHDFAINLTSTDGTNVIENENFTNISPSMGKTKTFEIPAGTYSLSELLIPYPDGDLATSSYTTVVVTGDTACPSMVGEEFEVSEGDDITCSIYNDDNGDGSTGGEGGIFFHRNSFPITMFEDFNLGEKIIVSNDPLSFGCPDTDGVDACLNSSADGGFTFVLQDPAITSLTTVYLINIIPVSGIDAPDCSIKFVTPNDEAFDLALECLNFVDGDYLVNYVLFESNIAPFP